ncbi:MAG: hypothetical protein L0Z70_16790 [Chloroflexi bacterium]|nr:hypothetical protein [Chloroflexota bacterium]
MFKRLILLLLLLLMAGLAPLAAISPRGQPAYASTDVIAGGLQGGCYQVSPSRCAIHVDPFTIHVDGLNARLVEFELQANGVTIYDFATSSTDGYKPLGDYTPSQVMGDFAVTCGYTYALNLLARDTDDVALLNTTLTGNVACPVGTYSLLLPVIFKR